MLAYELMESIVINFPICNIAHIFYRQFLVIQGTIHMISRDNTMYVVFIERQQTYYR